MAQADSSASIFSSLREREIRLRKVHSRPSVVSMTADGACSGSGVLAVEPNGISAPPLAISFGKTVDRSHFLAVADEEGFVSIFNTRRKLPSFQNSRLATGNARKEMWMAHSNAVFDVCWVQEDRHILTASGDQTVRLWDIEARAGLGVMKGHTGSVKTLCGHPSQPELFVSGSRDGNVALWDVRSSSMQSANNQTYYQPVSMIKDAHLPKTAKKSRGTKATTKSVTAVLYLHDDRILATAGAADGVVKFWDTRQLKSPVMQTPVESQTSSDGKEKRVHGISGLSQNLPGTFLIASCTDSRIYVYDVQNPDKGSVKSFHGHILGSFYIKAAFSPEGTHILSGSSDGNVFIWKMDNPDDAPVVLKGHSGEVTAVDWCPTDFCKMATCSDDFTVRVWNNLEPKFESVVCLRPSVLRRRISPDPISRTSFSDTMKHRSMAREEHQTCEEQKMEDRKREYEGERMECLMERTRFEEVDDASPASPSYRLSSSIVQTCEIYSQRMQEEDKKEVEECTKSVGSNKTLEDGSMSLETSLEDSPITLKTSSISNVYDTVSVSKTPLPDLSPASVLNPPGSSKRRKTITDYFGH